MRDLAANTIEYTRIKTSAGGNKEYLYERLLERIDVYLDEFDAHGTDHVSVELEEP